MKFVKKESGRNLFLVAAAVLVTAAAMFYMVPGTGTVVGANGPVGVVASPSATFPGANVGGITDGTSPCWNPGTGTARNVTFNATGLSGAPSGMAVSVTFGSPTHTWMGDITATLIAPNGASHTLFGHTGGTTATALGDSSDLGTTYVFSDTAPAPPSGGWWQASNTADGATLMPAGTYRTTAPGGAGATNPQPPTNMDAAFTGVANPNGTWTLRLTDSCTGDTGAVTAADLSITAAAVPHDANADFNGDGRTDFTVVRGTASPLSEQPDALAMRPGHGSPSWLDERPARSTEAPSVAPQAPPLYWYTFFTNNSTTLIQPLGDAATDFLTPEDFDGDGKDDLAVWTEAAGGSANFKILQSSTNTVQVQIFGQTDDDPAVVGDYDGDNKADAAVFRCPPNTGSAGQCFFFYRGTLNNPAGNITYMPWGFGVDGDFFPYVGDFDGDGKNDFCLQRANPASPTNGQFVLRRSSDAGVEYINWGLSSDFLIPGDYDGDGKTDICVRRTVSGQRQHWILTRVGTSMFQVWGITGDISAPGDYDGDGKTDLAIWRGSSTPGASQFWVLNSSNASITQHTWGQCPTANTCDFAVAGWAVH